MISLRILLTILIVLLASKGFTRSGTGYYFKDKRVMKKFYSDSSSHQTNKVAERVYRSSDLEVTPDDFTVTPSSFTGHKESTHFFIDRLVLRNRFAPPFRKQVFHLAVEFKAPYFMFVDLRPKKPLLLPNWAKALDFWVLATEPDIVISFYFEYPNGLKMRYNVPIKGDGWSKIYVNLLAGSKKTLFRDLPIKLTKIRVTRHSQKRPTAFSVFTGAIRAYNYLKSFHNLYLEPHETFADFENTLPRHWKYTIGNDPPSQPLAKLANHEGGSLVWERNKQYLSLSVPPSVHKNKDILIYFPLGFYKLKEAHTISLWIKGESRKEEVSLIFQEGRHRYFELEIAEIYFTGWRKITATIPKKEIHYFESHRNRERYVLLIGMKITPGTPSKDPIRLGFDQLEGLIEPGKLGNVKDL
ncbi:MAG TPA: hypothetical protein ENI73_00335 [Spirochaetes bacterium]|nr:hypothetical protein [Spirochaetota bacterium]